MVTIKTENIVPLSELQRMPGKIVARARDLREPIIITQHGRPAVVMVSCDFFEELERGAVELKKADKMMGERERALREELQRVTADIVALYDPEKIVLFGSLARGQVSESSDIDLVIVKKTDKKFWERQKELASLIRPRIACDMLIYTPQEWDDAVAEGREFVEHDVKGQGKVIYERAA